MIPLLLFYDSLVLRAPLEPLEPPRAHKAAVRAALEAREIERIERVDESGTATEVRANRLGDVERTALMAALRPDGAGPGGESDLWVRDRDGVRAPVSVWWDEPGVVRLAVGEGGGPVASEIPDELDAWLDDALVDTDVAWGEAGRAIVAEAVRNLHPEVRGQLEGLPFVRVAEPSAEVVLRLGVPMTATLQATYIDDATNARVEVYDAALAPTERFTGTPWAPRSEAVRVIAHELAHAVSNGRNRAQMEIARDGNRRAVELVAEHNALVLEMNGLVDRFHARPDPELGARIDAIQTRIGELAGKLEALDRQMAQLAAAVGPDRTSPAAVAMNAVRPRDQSPTWYGRTSVEEHFAECYALFLTDPAALERAAPELYAWFLAGSHRVHMKEGS